ncbi:hypothetical protein GCM10020358_76730 [Amorphoplanes nipponensis]|uniref:Uncharacterized protein n=1 Tax=Actinoplanes nipponensis TaxID=135950 RepID=A0A919JIR9_9ACTN|nr:hypothetical protein [Actinoplanes nipponensis]GIE49966.1 hypothetical protein Ani05nite_35000 [Actinoplanes nipponensis]
MSPAGLSSDAELLSVDVPEAIAAALRTTEPARQLLLGAAAPAALQAAGAGVRPRSVRFLAEIVRRGGIEVAARLAEPMPAPEQTEVVRPWLVVAHGDDRVFADWLDAVAAIIDARLSRP